MKLNPLLDSRDMRFVLFEMFEVEKLTKYEKFSDFDREIFESTLDLAEQIAVNRLYEVNMEGDKDGVNFNPDTGEVKAPASFKEPMEIVKEAGFFGMSFDSELGGMGMPHAITRAVIEYFFSANISFTIYQTLTTGAANLVKAFATNELKEMFFDKMITGQWGGTMCLTEPDAGSDVGALKAKAVKQEDGTYLISGQKIFISAGENDLFENIVHPVLARIEGDPPGSKGISIFLVPKYLVKPDGTLGERNDLVCSGVEHKMGIHGSATCTLNFGDNNKCVGYLLGEERKGIRIMFQMMNEARLDVAGQGLALSSSAYMHAVTFAKNRVQSKDVTKPKGSGSVPIINHPDVKRMLLWMKSMVEAMRMLTSYLNVLVDIAHEDSGDKAKEAEALVDFLTPICKAGNSDNSWLVTGEAVQVHGGYGFCSDYRVEQLARDSKITSIYEGTSGIQSMDLTMRKLLLNTDMYNYKTFKKKVNETLKGSEGIVEKKYTAPFKDAVEKMDDIVDLLKGQLASGKLSHVLSNATPLQQSFVMLSYAWMHIWSLSITIPKLKELTGNVSDDKLNKIIADNSEAAYYHGKSLSSRFYLGSEFGKIFGKMDCILSEESAVIEATPDIFTGAPEE